jgi:hypothetical protein
MKNDVIRRGSRYGGGNLDGALMDADYALMTADFTDPDVKKTGDSRSMVVYSCRPNWSPAEANEVVRRLENAWTDSAFAQEAHSIEVDADLVTLEFVTWSDQGDYYTGRIEVALARPE